MKNNQRYKTLDLGRKLKELDLFNPGVKDEG